MMDRKRELDVPRLFRSSCLTDSVCRSFKILKNSKKGKRFIHPPRIFLATGDEVVPYKHGERSYQALSLSGFRNLSYKTYEGYLKIPHQS